VILTTQTVPNSGLTIDVEFRLSFSYSFSLLEFGVLLLPCFCHLYKVTLPDGSTVAMPEYLYRAILSEQRRIQRRLGEWPLDGESDSDSDDAYESEPTSD
jgi:hypothetical protein